MDLKVSAHRLCLLLSWQEALRRTPQQEPFAGRSQRNQASQAIADLRNDAREAIQLAGEELQRLLADGGEPAAVDALRHRIQQLNHLLKAEQSSDLGGPVAMTLEAYAHALGKVKAVGPYGFTPLERQDYAVLTTSIFLMVAICLGLAWFQLWRANTAFSLERAGTHHLALTIRNGGQNRIEFLGSWPSLIKSGDVDTYGVNLYCRAPGADEFQYANSVGELWSFQNEVLAPQRRISIEPGVTITVLLDLRELEAGFGSPLAAVRVECGTETRRRRATFEEVFLP